MLCRTSTPAQNRMASSQSSSQSKINVGVISESKVVVQARLHTISSPGIHPVLLTINAFKASNENTRQGVPIKAHYRSLSHPFRLLSGLCSSITLSSLTGWLINYTRSQVHYVHNIKGLCKRRTVHLHTISYGQRLSSRYGLRPLKYRILHHETDI